jgi:DNA invertase Pin-like site-specific DNA recombinase
LGYVRVSTEEQAELGVSLEAQQAKLTAYAGLYDLGCEYHWNGKLGTVITLS